MFKTSIKRVIKAGFLGFYRNRFISMATLFIMTITLLLIGSIFFARFVVDTTLSQMKSKVDINVYFTVTAEPEKILTLVSDIKRLPEVLSVDYKTREEALADFENRHKGDELTIQALKEIEKNPFGAVLSIKARDTNQYESIAKFLEGDSKFIAENPSVIDKINYRNNKVIIDKLNIITKGISVWGNILSIVFIAISLMITFVTIRLAIYNFRDEISVMRLVGASNMYIRGPFIVEGMIYGFIASIFATILFLPISIWSTDKMISYLGGISFFDYYKEHFFFLSGTLFLTGILVGSISSFLAVRKYLR